MQTIEKLKRLIYLVACQALPFSIGFAVIPTSDDYATFHNYLQVFLTFILLFLLWRLFRSIFIAVNIQPQRKWLYPPLVLLAIAQMVVLQVFQSRVAPELFYFTLTAIVAAGLHTIYSYKKLFGLALIARFFEDLLISFLSISFLTGEFLPEALCLAFAPAMICCAFNIAYLSLNNSISIYGIRHLKNTSGSSLSASQSISECVWSTIYSSCIIFAPFIVVGMAVFQLLPKHYILMLALAALSSGNLNRCALSDGKNLNREAFFNEASGICLLFMAMIRLLRLF